MSNILVCWIFRGDSLGVAVDDLADGALFAHVESLKNLLTAPVEELGLVVPVNHLHDFAANTRIHLGEANLEPADLATGLATEPLLKLVRVYARSVNVVSRPASPAEAYGDRVSEE